MLIFSPAKKNNPQFFLQNSTLKPIEISRKKANTRNLQRFFFDNITPQKYSDQVLPRKPNSTLISRENIQRSNPCLTQSSATQCSATQRSATQWPASQRPATPTLRNRTQRQRIKRACGETNLTHRFCRAQGTTGPPSTQSGTFPGAALKSPRVQLQGRQRQGPRRPATKRTRGSPWHR